MTTDVVGGVFTYTAELAAALEALGHDVVVATLGGAPRPDQRERLPAEVHTSEFALEWMDGAGVEPSAQWLARLEAEVGPDIVHLCSYAHGAVAFAAPQGVVGHSCVCSWWRAVHGCEAPAGWAGYRARVVSGLHLADAVVAPTAAMLAELRALYGVEGGLVVHNGSAAPPTSPDKETLVLGAGRLW